jgi:hypothetical protein
VRSRCRGITQLCRAKPLACASVPQCALSERADGSGERVSVSATPRSADWCRKLIEGGAEERVAALRDGRGVQRAAVASEPRESLAVYHGRRVERGDGMSRSTPPVLGMTSDMLIVSTGPTSSVSWTVLSVDHLGGGEAGNSAVSRRRETEGPSQLTTNRGLRNPRMSDTLLGQRSGMSPEGFQLLR